MGGRADARPALDPRALRRRAAARRHPRGGVPARHRGDGEPRALADRGRRRGRPDRLEPALDPGRGRGRAGRRAPRRGATPVRRRGPGRLRGARRHAREVRAAEHARRWGGPAHVSTTPAGAARRHARGRRRRHGSPAPARARGGGPLAVPVIAVNEARSERLFNDHYGRAVDARRDPAAPPNLLLAGRTIVVLGYGWTGQGIALRAPVARAPRSIVCEIDPMQRARGADGGLRGHARRSSRPSAATSSSP
jgi:hypothetical protein